MHTFNSVFKTNVPSQLNNARWLRGCHDIPVSVVDINARKYLM